MLRQELIKPARRLDVSDLLATVSKGFLAYVRDPDGTTVEFVEVQSIFWLSSARFIRIAMPLLRLYDRLTPG